MITRRHLLPFLVLGVGVPALVYNVWTAATHPPPTPSVRNPRFRRKRPQPSMQVSLGAGFYLNTRSKIVHYVDDKGTVRHVQRLNTGLLTPVAPGATGGWPTGSRANRRSAAGAFESLARKHLHVRDQETAMVVLEEAVTEDLSRLGSRPEPTNSLVTPATTGVERLARANGRLPGYNVYDLLARESLRMGKEATLRRLIAQIGRQPPDIQRLFASRIARWSDATGNWHKKQMNLSKAG
jgi:hypothetical protein